VPNLPLTEVEQRVLDLVRRSLRESCGVPTLRAIADHCGWASTRAAGYHLERLEEKGYLRRLGRGWQRLEVAGERRGDSIPLAGPVAAGAPIQPGDYDGERFAFHELFAQDDLVAMRVRGDSMIEDHIKDGDYVLVRCRPEAESGEKVVCCIDGELTLKVLRRSGGAVWLHPCNSKRRRIQIDEKKDSRVIGVLVGVVRKEG
jgi:repressor LexA